jgi:hypothetical protein
MNRTKLKTYAPQARREFIQAVTDRAAYYGLTAKHIEPITEKGDVAIIAGKPFPRAVAQKRKALEERINRQGFEQTMEALAYTWFNRLVAIRFMELHGYLDHGYRVLSHPEGKTTPEILEHAEHVDLPGLDKSTVIDLKLDGSKEAELYRLLLIAQCNALHAAMPFLFERIDDETELLLPDNLLHSDSLIRKLVNEIGEEDWQEVEIIGWLYQFYISEKKDQVIGKVVKSEDIPAATQLFTPNWIVKYLVQNSLGRQWLATYPNSPLRQQMEYYIEPAEQTPEVQAQLKAITPESLNPEEITLLDPACGSGHILVEAYDLFKAIYQERGYRARDIPTLILQKNLFGLEIDDRAAQLAAFALMMKARADDRRIFTSGVQPHVLAIQESKGLNTKAISEALNTPLAHGEKKGEKGNVSPADVGDLINLFEQGKTFGSLIQVPPQLAEKLPAIERRVRDILAHGDLMTQPAAKVLLPLIEQAWMLSRQYDTVVTNPPYMGTKFYAPNLKAFIRREYQRSQGDLYTCFMIRNLDLARSSGFVGMITIPNWMFLSSFDQLRDDILGRGTIDTFIHNGRGVFGSDFGSCSFVVRRHCNDSFSGSYRRLFEKQGSVADNEELKQRFFTAPTYTAKQLDFRAIPGQPIAYWISERMRQCFQDGTPLGDIAELGQGMATSDNGRFLRRWHEVDIDKVGMSCPDRETAKASGRKWFPYNKGGEFRRWFGNNEYLVNWENDGSEVLEYAAELYGSPTRTIKNIAQYFRPALTWSFISSSFFAVRCSDAGFLFDVAGSSAFPPDEWRECIAGFLCSNIAFDMMKVLNPTMNFQVGNVAALPILQPQLLARKSAIEAVVREAVQLARTDWDSFETSWDFQTLPVLQQRAATLAQSQAAADAEVLARFQRMKQLEEENNRLFIEAYGLQDELSPEVPEDQITLARPDREEDIKRLISYAIGCMMGRYKPRNTQNTQKLPRNTLNTQKEEREDLSCDSSISWSDLRFEPDLDAIIPIMDNDWFPEDAANRFVEFISVAWPKEHLEENLTFVAESLGVNRGEQPRDTIRRYLAQGFFKDHLKTYKRRPIYWLFSSGKQRAFQCLVYLHRYHEGTLARMRTEYVIPLQGKLNARIEQLASEVQRATSTSHRKKLEKEQDTLRKQQAELQAFDEKLRHYADMRISLDLDDGVKVNYGKFGDLLAEVKTVCGE